MTSGRTTSIHDLLQDGAGDFDAIFRPRLFRMIARIASLVGAPYAEALEPLGLGGRALTDPWCWTQAQLAVLTFFVTVAADDAAWVTNSLALRVLRRKDRVLEVLGNFPPLCGRSFPRNMWGPEYMLFRLPDLARLRLVDQRLTCPLVAEGFDHVLFGLEEGDLLLVAEGTSGVAWVRVGRGEPLPAALTSELQARWPEVAWDCLPTLFEAKRVASGTRGLAEDGSSWEVALRVEEVAGPPWPPGPIPPGIRHGQSIGEYDFEPPDTGPATPGIRGKPLH